MRQFILPAWWKGEEELRLTGEDHHYLTRVLRYAPGTVFPGRDGRGKCFRLTLLCAEGDFSLLGIQEEAPAPSGDGLHPLILYTSLLKGKNSDLIIRQATEAGVIRIQPMISRNTVVRPGEKTEGRLERWKKIAKEASQQCGNPGVPEILAPLPLEKINLDIFRRDAAEGPAFGLFFHEKPLENKTLHEYLYDTPGPVSLFFGPEGGFSPEEVKRFLSSGMAAAYLGTNVLRGETAVVYGLGVVQTLLRERNTWQLATKT